MVVVDVVEPLHHLCLSVVLRFLIFQNMEYRTDWCLCAPEKNFTLLGMAGVMAGVMHAPLTGIFLIAEITSGFHQLFMPLMIVSFCSYLTINILSPTAFMECVLPEGKLIATIQTVPTDIDELRQCDRKEYSSVTPDMPLGHLVQVISRSHTTFYLCWIRQELLIGIIDLTKIRHIVFRTELYQKFTVKSIDATSP